MRTEKICFSNEEALSVFPDERFHLTQAISELHLDNHSPVIVLIGGGIDIEQEAITRQALETLAWTAEDIHASVICGGTEMGVMAEIGQIRSRNAYKFPLVGIAPAALVTWPGGPRSTKFLWWGKQRWPLARHYSHFILVPGSQFGDESPWIVDTATLLSKGQESVTILMNGGAVSRKDIELSLEKSRPVIALNGTGRLANELAGQQDRHKLITVIPASAKQQVIEVVRGALSDQETRALIKANHRISWVT